MDQNETAGPQLLKLGIVMSILPTIAILLRFWARLLTAGKRKLWWDDWLALCSWCCCICCCAFTIYGVQLGLGKHFTAFKSKADVTQLLKIFYVSQIVFDLGITFAKFSALCFYARIFSNKSKHYTIAYRVTFALVAVFILYKLPAQIFSCIPPSKNWHPEMEGHCENNYTNFLMLIMGLILDVITDLLILILPMPMIIRLQVTRKKTIALVCVFIAGYVTLITSLGRMASFISIKPHLGDPDISWYQVPELSWSMAEIATSVISICSPSWMTLFKRYMRGGLPSLFNSRDLSVEPTPALYGGARGRQSMAFQLMKTDSNADRATSSRDDKDSVDQFSQPQGRYHI
ncbi:hypothetical protein QQS21_000454 [Conoideocrella luteorostrata]|uniref:Rhodopsin domain-containing protein n=1 Tax=Conoideocrella luteorostrata TaxID=1105319 RepID=A0AAJ0D105_9HYPO|nr:hypothetical protein QQS21_000454 [Conoideocrella luteorostrata]